MMAFALDGFQDCLSLMCLTSIHTVSLLRSIIIITHCNWECKQDIGYSAPQLYYALLSSYPEFLISVYSQNLCFLLKFFVNLCTWMLHVLK